MIDSPLLPHLDAYIDGRWTRPASGKTFKVINPATGEQLADVASLARDEVTAAIEAASKALRTPSSFEQRHAWLTGIAQALREDRKSVV